MEKKDLSLFREYVKKKYKYASIYANSVSKFAEHSIRWKVFKIKSDLAHDFEKDEFLYIPVNMGRAITRIFKDYVIGMWYDVDYWKEEVNKKRVEISDKIHLQNVLDTWIETQSSIWYSIIRVRKDSNWNTRAELIPLPNYLASVRDLNIGDWFLDIKEHFVYSVQKDENDNKYFYVDRYEKQEDWSYKWYYGEKREYNVNYILNNKLAEWIEEPLEELPLFLFNNDLDNPHSIESEDEVVWWKKYVVNMKDYVWDIPRYFNQSDYVDLADLFQEINDRWSQISVEFIKNLTSKLSVPAWFKDNLTAQALRKPKEERKFIENPDFITHNAWETPATYIQKSADYVQVSINDYIPYLMKIIGFLSTIPSSLLTNAIFWWNNPVWTTEKEFQPFYSRIEAKQQRIYSELQRMFRLIMKSEWIEVDLPTIKFKKPATYDINARTNTAVMQLNAWIMSKSSAIAYTMWYDSQEVEEELKKIDEETANAYKRDDSFLEKFKEDENEDNNEWITVEDIEDTLKKLKEEE